MAHCKNLRMLSHRFTWFLHVFCICFCVGTHPLLYWHMAKEARQQILEHRRHCKACQQDFALVTFFVVSESGAVEEPLPLPPPPAERSERPKPEPEPQPQLTPARMREVAWHTDLMCFDGLVEMLAICDL